jgi:hypothetical protein
VVIVGVPTVDPRPDSSLPAGRWAPRVPPVRQGGGEVGRRRGKVMDKRVQYLKMLRDLLRSIVLDGDRAAVERARELFLGVCPQCRGRFEKSSPVQIFCCRKHMNLWHTGEYRRRKSVEALEPV